MYRYQSVQISGWRIDHRVNLISKPSKPPGECRFILKFLNESSVPDTVMPSRIAWGRLDHQFSHCPLFVTKEPESRIGKLLRICECQSYPVRKRRQFAGASLVPEIKKLNAGSQNLEPAEIFGQSKQRA